MCALTRSFKSSGSGTVTTTARCAESEQLAAGASTLNFDLAGVPNDILHSRTGNNLHACSAILDQRRNQRGITVCQP